MHISVDTLCLFPSDRPLLKPAILIQPALVLFLMVDETAEIRNAKKILESVLGPEEAQTHPQVAVPLGLENRYGLSLEQAEYLINRMYTGLRSNFVTHFYEYLCLDADTWVWIEDEMAASKTE